MQPSNQVMIKQRIGLYNKPIPVSFETVMKWHTAGIQMKVTRVAAGYLVQFR